jgi:outer membrane protein assembly factor BamE (lipoprotein component of BamABCDE complex)
VLACTPGGGRSTVASKVEVEYVGKTMMNATIGTLVGTALLAGCSVPKLPSDADSSKSNMSVGVVQREIRKGMTGGEVATVLGSPNIVTSGPGGTEVWVYDRTFSQVETASASTGVWFVVGTTGQNSGVARSSQSTLTVVIKFDAEKRVADVAYHQSKF